MHCQNGHDELITYFWSKLHVLGTFDFKILLLVFKCLTGEAPVYLQEMIVKCELSLTLRSSNPMLLKLPRVKRKTLGTRSFRYAGPKLWNDLPMNIQQAQDIDAFKSMLKTHLFKLAYEL